MASIHESFVLGGWGMYPTALFGLLLVGTAAGHAWRPDPRQVPALVALTLLTVVSGALGFVTGAIKTLHHAAEHPQVGKLAALGLSHNLALAFLLAMIAGVGVVAGTLRRRHGGPRRPSAAPPPRAPTSSPDRPTSDADGRRRSPPDDDGR